MATSDLEPWQTTLEFLQETVGSAMEVLENDGLLYVCFEVIYDHVTALIPIMTYLHHGASYFDFRDIPANGFRTLLLVMDICLEKITELCCCIYQNKDSYFFFQRSAMIHDLEEYIRILGGLRSISIFAEHLMQEQICRGSLFITDRSELIPAFLEEIETINQEIFYGRSLGFQYCRSIRDSIRTVEVAMVVCADTYFSRRKTKPDFEEIASTFPGAKSVIKMSLYPEYRSKILVSTTRNPNVHFCQQFWNLTGAWYLQSLHSLFMPKVALNCIIEMQPELLKVQGIKGASVFIRPAIWTKSVSGRLISAKLREGQQGIEILPDNVGSACDLKSPYLIFHAHGGGFIAQSSKAHEVYLLKWAVELDIPIFSIDYSLAPSSPYPEPMNEVIFAYAWALLNHEKLGWTGEHICFVGDSAGGLLLVSAAMKLSCMDVKLPDGILTVYAPFLVQYAPSPSRLMCVMDPLLPLGIMVRCLSSYGYRFPEPTDVGLVQGIDDGIDERSRRHRTGRKNSGSVIFETSEESHDRSIDSTDQNFVHCSDESDSSEHCLDVDVEAVTNVNLKDMPHKWSFPGFFPLGMGLLGKSLHAVSSRISLKSARSPFPSSLQNLVWPAEKVAPLRRHKFASLSAEDPFLSPLFADDNLLSGLPPMLIVACHLDPLLDDSITLARRLDQIDHPVRLDVLGGLPHGFLSMALMSKEASDGADLCLNRIRNIFRLPYS